MEGDDTPSILNKKELAGNPFMQFELWLEEARADRDITEPDAMALATATKDGTPSARMVMLRDYDQRGFVFYTNYESPKGKQLAENARAELLLYWGKLKRQVSPREAWCPSALLDHPLSSYIFGMFCNHNCLAIEFLFEPLTHSQICWDVPIV